MLNFCLDVLKIALGIAIPPVLAGSVYLLIGEYRPQWLLRILRKIRRTKTLLEVMECRACPDAPGGKYCAEHDHYMTFIHDRLSEEEAVEKLTKALR